MNPVVVVVVMIVLMIVAITRANDQPKPGSPPANSQAPPPTLPVRQQPLNYWLQLFIGATLSATLMGCYFIAAVVIAFLTTGPSGQDQSEESQFVALGLVTVIVAIVAVVLFHRLAMSGVVLGLLVTFGVGTIIAGRSNGYYGINEQFGWVVGGGALAAGMRVLVRRPRRPERGTAGQRG